MSNDGETQRRERIEAMEMASPPSIRDGVGAIESARMADSRSTPASFTFHHTPRAQSGHTTAGPSQADGHPEGLTPLTHPTHSDRTVETSPHTGKGAGSKVDPIAEKRRQIELASRELEWQIRELAIQEERRAYEQEQNATVNDTTSASTAEMRKAEEWLDTTDRCGEAQPARGVGFLGENPAERSLLLPEYASRSGFSEWRRMMEASAAVNRHSAWTGPTMTTQGHQPDLGGRHCDTGAIPKASEHHNSLHYAEGMSPRGFPAPNVNLSGTFCNTTLLNQSQLAARQSTSKDLPTFSGSAAEWPLFIARYELSSTLCGFSDDENLLRLQKALTGAARKAVEHLLLLPSGLKDAINILRTRFGRPELIVESLIERVRRMPAPRNDQLDTLAEFGFEVQNLCATIRATGMYGYMCDVTLLRELTTKLPDTTFIEWARHRRDLPNASLFEFGKWIGDLALDISAAAPLSGRAVHHKSQTNEPRQTTARWNLHTTITPDSKSPALPSKCALCHYSCVSMASCEVFRKMAVNARRTFVKASRLCKQCLISHRGPCQEKKPCEIGGCGILHHQLLHIDTTQHQIHTLTHCSTNTEGDTTVLFRYIPVTLHGPKGSLKTFAFFDEGSTSTFVEHGLIQELGLQGTPHPLHLKWTGTTTREEKGSVQVALRISSGHESGTVYELPRVHSMKELALPEQTVSTERLFAKYAHLRGLPIEPYKGATPRVLIGIDNCRLGQPLKSYEGKKDEPTAAKTRLGWVVYGPCIKTIATRRGGMASFHIRTCNVASDDALVSTLRQSRRFPQSVAPVADNEAAMNQQAMNKQNQLQETKRLASLECTSAPPLPTSPSTRKYGTLKGLEQRMNPQLNPYDPETDPSIAQARRDNRERPFNGQQMLFLQSAGGCSTASGATGAMVARISESAEAAIEPFRARLGQRMLIKCDSSRLRLLGSVASVNGVRPPDSEAPHGQIEHYLGSVTLYDARASRKLTENFYFDLNGDHGSALLSSTCRSERSLCISQNTSNRSDQIGNGTLRPGLTKCDTKGELLHPDAVPKEWLTRSRQAIFSVGVPQACTFMVLRIDRILQGAISPSLAPYLKATKDPKVLNKCRTMIEQCALSCGYYRMPVVWAARPPFQLYSNDLDTSGEFPAIYRQKEAKLRVDDLLKLPAEDCGPDRFGELTVMPGTLKVYIESLNVWSRSCLTNSLVLLNPSPIPPATEPMLGATEFASNTERRFHPIVQLVSHLFAYPLHLNCLGKEVFSRARHIAVTEELRDGATAEERSSDCIYGRLSQEILVSRVSCPVLHHGPKPAWCEEVKFPLPLNTAPHFGGCWELVRSVKKPLVPFDDSPDAIRSSWKATERNAVMFWKEWVAAYLPTLTRRTKSFQTVETLQPGGVVQVVDSGLPRNRWPKGRFIEMVQAKDGQVRMATEKGRSGTLQRPERGLTRLDVLPGTYLAELRDDAGGSIVNGSALNLDGEVD